MEMYPSASSFRVVPAAASTHSAPGLLSSGKAYPSAAAAMMLVVMLTMILCAGLCLVSAQEESDASTNIIRMVQDGIRCTPAGSVASSEISARFNALKQSLSGKASVALYGLSEDIDLGTGYGASVMYQCRGDLLLSDCAVCVKSAFSTLNNNCSNPGFAQVELQGCGVIYSNQSIQGGYYNFLTFLVSTVSKNATYFQNRKVAVTNVTDQAIANKKKLGTYWAVDVVGNDTADVCYALAQCHGYLTPNDCAQCLSLASTQLLYLVNETGARIYFGSCYARYEYNIFYNASNTPTILTSLGPPPALAPSPAPTASLADTSPGKGFDVRFMVVLVVVIGSLCLIVGCLAGWFSHSFRTRETQVYKNLEFRKPEETSEYIDLQHASIQHFSLPQLQKATNKFHVEKKIGEGGFGVVYLGTLENGDRVAIKKLMNLNSHGREQFLNEVKLIRSLQHRNLVKIIGCSHDGDDDSRFLVYEYLSNQSLDKHLFASSGKDILSWDIRRDILEGVAKGLTYLHHDSHQPVIHRDIKAANILLDDNFNPKIADFGMAKLFAFNLTHLSTNVAGTMGYIAPEYALNGQVSTKSDVFSFGVLMLEVISGRRVFTVSSPENQQYLLHWTWRLHQEGRELEIVDAAMKQDWAEEEVKRFIRVALLCCQTSPSQRPSMLAVAEMLVGLDSVLDIPTMPTYLASTNTFSHQ